MNNVRIALLAAMAMTVAVASSAQKKPVTLSNLLEKGTFRTQSVSGIRSMANGTDYTSKVGNNVVKYSYATGNAVDTILREQQFAKAKVPYFDNYEFSADENKILLRSNFKPIYRRSFTADYFIYDTKTKAFEPLSKNGAQSYATFSPDGTRVAFVRDNNLFYKNLQDGSEVQVTNDGKKNSIINGSTDWVYEEEFGFPKAFEWSPDSKKLAYYKFDETRVKVFNMTKFQGSLYPENYTFKYPKAGEQNAIVSIYTYDLSSGKNAKMDVGNEDDQYIARIKWSTSPKMLAIIRLNRLQNKIEILGANPETGKHNIIYSETNPCYINEVTDEYLNFLPDGKQFVINSEKDGFNHLYLYNIDGSLANQITQGKWEVREYLGFDPDKREVYYSASKESPLRQEVYATSINGKNTRTLSAERGTNNAVFSNGMKYYINFYSSSKNPLLVTLHKSNGKQIRVLQDNAALRDTLKSYEIAQKEFFTFTTPEGVELNGWMMKPVGFDASKRYPVLMTQYSGPGSQEVLDEWQLGWEIVLAQKGYLVVCVDGRGTGGRGAKFRSQTYGQLGKYEVQDQISAAKYVAALPFADPQRIAIWGWSYGGFMALNSITQGADVFKLAIAVAPVTNWRFYDSIYTERFNGLPQDNASGYDDNSPINHAEKLKGKLLIVHGTADDNVHMQNTIEFVNKLVQNNKQYDMMIYADKNHSIYGGNTRLQLYTKFVDYLDRNL